MLATATPPASTGLAALCAATATVVVTARRGPAGALERSDERGAFAGVGLDERGAFAGVGLDERGAFAGVGLDERGVFAGVGLALADVVLDGAERVGLAVEPLRLEAAADPLRLDAAVDPLRLDAADRAPFDAAVDPLRRDVAPFALAVLVGSAIGSSVRTALHLRSFPCWSATPARPPIITGRRWIGRGGGL